MASQKSLPLVCCHCDGAVTLEESHWPAVSQLDRIWICPYCGRRNEGGFPGRMSWVTPRDARGEAME